MLKLKLQYFGRLMRTHWKRENNAGNDWKQKEKGAAEDEMARWEAAFEQTLGVGDGQGSLVCCSPWGCKESNMTTTSSREFCSILRGSLVGKGARGRMDTCIPMSEALCCPPKTIATLLISYTPI